MPKNSCWTWLVSQILTATGNLTVAEVLGALRTKKRHGGRTWERKPLGGQSQKVREIARLRER
eukprot:14378287-Heterocapsa_arctica.AAC.1